MQEYSGRTTCYAHKHKDWKQRDGTKNDCIQQVTLFDVQWSSCPVEVELEVEKLWRNYDLGNDHYYVKWESEDMADSYPVIDIYLKSRNIEKCLIHWWW